MKKRMLICLMVLTILSGCSNVPTAEDDTVHILATTYPVYLLAAAATEGTEHVEVNLLVNAQTSCLHDYTLTVENMKAIDAADVIVMNGVGLEDFMAHAVSASTAPVIDCSAGIDLLPALEHGHTHETEHDGEDEWDAHIWMDPVRYAKMFQTVSEGLTSLGICSTDDALLEDVSDQLLSFSRRWQDILAELPPNRRKLITFHDGFQYFAEAFHLELAAAIEEEEGATVSAAELRELTAFIEQYEIPIIFTERNGSAATAETLRRETGCEVGQLNMLMSGEESGLTAYFSAMETNLNTIWEGLG